MFTIIAYLFVHCITEVFSASLLTVRLFSVELCSYSRSSSNVLLCLSAMSVCAMCRRCWISAVFFT